MRNGNGAAYSLIAVIVIGVIGPVETRASLIVSAGSVSIAAGGSGFVDITLQNTSSTAFATPIDGFSVELNLAGDGAVTFTGATMSSAATYIFAGNSLDVALAPPLNFFSSSPAPRIADIAASGDGTTIAGNTTLELGRITFTVATDISGIAPITLTTDGTTGISDVNGGAIAATLSSGQITITTTGETSVPEPSIFCPLAFVLAACSRKVRRRSRELRAS